MIIDTSKLFPSWIKYVLFILIGIIIILAIWVVIERNRSIEARLDKLDVDKKIITSQIDSMETVLNIKFDSVNTVLNNNLKKAKAIKTSTQYEINPIRDTTIAAKLEYITKYRPSRK